MYGSLDNFIRFCFYDIYSPLYYYAIISTTKHS